MQNEEKNGLFVKECKPTWRVLLPSAQPKVVKMSKYEWKVKDAAQS